MTTHGGDVTAASQTSRQGSKYATPSVLIVSDVRLYREGLAEILGQRAEVDVAGAAADAESLVGAGLPRATLILVDMGMPAGTDVVRKLVRLLPAAKVLALTVSEDERQVIECAEAGVVGYLTRESSLDDLVAAMQAVERDEFHCSPRVAATLLRRVGALAEGVRPAEDGTPLTARELEIVDLLDAGLTNKEIASRLFIEIPTVKNHVHNILEKLHVRRRSEVGASVRARRARSASVGATDGSRI